MAKLIKFAGNRQQHNEVLNLANEVLNHDWVVFVPSKEADLVQYGRTVWRKDSDDGRWWPEEGPEDLDNIYLCDAEEFMTNCMIALLSDCTVYAIDGSLEELHRLLYGQENGDPLLPVPVWRTFRSRAGLEYYVKWFSSDDENQKEIDNYNDWCEKTYQRGW